VSVRSDRIAFDYYDAMEENGTPVTLSRRVGTSSTLTSATVKAISLRASRAHKAEVSTQQFDQVWLMSPLGLTKSGWSGGDPKKNDIISDSSGSRITIETVDTTRIDGVAVRYSITARGT
jgi:hypothetical protein